VTQESHTFCISAADGCGKHICLASDRLLVVNIRISILQLDYWNLCMQFLNKALPLLDHIAGSPNFPMDERAFLLNRARAVDYLNFIVGFVTLLGNLHSICCMLRWAVPAAHVLSMP